MYETNVFKKKYTLGFWFKKVFTSFCAGMLVVFLVTICFGYTYKIIGSASMTPTLAVNSLILISPTAYEDLKIGDIITFKASADDTSGLTFTHRIHSIDETTGYFKTKGDANAEVDTNPVNPERYVGKVIVNLNAVGHIITFVKANMFLTIFYLMVFAFALIIFI